MKGYKAFNYDMSCRGFKYEVGKTYETNRGIGLCEWGFHFCKNVRDCYLYYSYGSDTRIAEVEAVGKVIEGSNKCVTNAIKIIKELSPTEIDGLVNCGESNRGYSNTGKYNNGNYNAGSYNIGCSNTGAGNVGNYNSGSYNHGSINTGDHNHGNNNVGGHNTGDSNVGDHNYGHSNTGDCNIGNYNTGDFNHTNFSSGLFCTKEHRILMFNKPSSMTYLDWRGCDAFWLLRSMPKIQNTHDNQIRQSWYDALRSEDKECIKSLENFDAKIFYECTGIKVEEYEEEQ